MPVRTRACGLQPERVHVYEVNQADMLVASRRWHAMGRPATYWCLPTSPTVATPVTRSVHHGPACGRYGSTVTGSVATLGQRPSKNDASTWQAAPRRPALVSQSRDWSLPVAEVAIAFACCLAPRRRVLKVQAAACCSAARTGTVPPPPGPMHRALQSVTCGSYRPRCRAGSRACGHTRRKTARMRARWRAAS